MYCTVADIGDMLPEDRLIELTDDDGFGSVNLERVDAVIASAQGEVDGFLGERWPVPLVTTPPLIKSIIVDLVIYRLYSRKHDEAPETRRKQYENGVALLRKIADGKISLGVPDPPEPENSETAGAAEFETGRTVFNGGGGF